MARYDFRCRSCGSTFEVERPMAEAGEPAVCPEGHVDTVKLMNVFASVGVSGAVAPATPQPGPLPAGVAVAAATPTDGGVYG